MLPYPLNVYTPTYFFTVFLKVASVVRQGALMSKYIVLLITQQQQPYFHNSRPRERLHG